MKQASSDQVFLPSRSPRRPTSFTLAPGKIELESIVERLRLLGLSDLGFAGTFTPSGQDDWRFEGRLVAKVVQACVVSLAPVETRIEETVTRRYVADLPDPAESEAEMPEDDSLERLPRAIDLYQMMEEALDLALPTYPRAPGAGTAAQRDDSDSEVRRPFAGLGDLLSGTGRNET